MKKTIPYVFEFFVVLVSVYLAFVLTNWHEQQKINREINQSYNDVNEEIFNNYRQVHSLNEKTRNSFVKFLKYRDIKTRQEMNNLFLSFINIFNTSIKFFELNGIIARDLI